MRRRRRSGKAGERTELPSFGRPGGDRRQRGADRDRGELADAGAEIGERLAFELRARHEADRQRVHRNAIAIDFIVKMRAGRQAARPDIADDLTAIDMLARAHRDAAHMAVTGAQTRAMVQFHIVAETAGPPRDRHHAVADRINGRAVAAAEIDAAMHARVAEDRVAAHAEGRGDAAVRRTDHAAALLPDARRLIPLGAAIDRPFDHRQLRFSAAHQPGVKQLARLALARFGAAMVEDDVEFVRCANIAADRNLAADHAQIGLDRLGRCAGGARRAIEAVADPAADAQRRIVDRDRDAAHHQPAVDTLHLDPQVEARAHRECIDGARHRARGAAAEDQVNARSRCDIGQRDGARDLAGDRLRIGAADA